jgi:imidazolonepropionase
VRVVTTFLGAHAVPEELRGNRNAYVRQVIDEQLPRCAPLADCIDVYCDRGAFTLDEAVEILTAGRARGLGVRAHAEQVEHTGIAEAAAALGATSVDHLERIDDRGIAAMAAHGTVAGLLPAAQVYLRDVSPPVAKLREAGVAMAVGTDLNPGTSPLRDLWIAATLATIVQGLTIPEAVLGITRNAGKALGRADLGWLGEGSVADLAVFRPPPGEPPAVESLVQFLGDHRAALVVRDGRVVHR